MLSLLLALFVPLAPSVAVAQPWSGILAPVRAIDWGGVGVQGGIPSASWANCVTTACNTLWNAGVDGVQVTAANINAAIASAPARTVVRIPGNGTVRTMNTGLLINRNNVVVRGQGATATILRFTGAVSTSCHIAGDRAVGFCTGSANIGVDSPDHAAAWSAGYAKGTTVITLNSVTGLTVGSTIWLDQVDEGADGSPLTGDIWTATFSGSGEDLIRSGRGVTEGHTVTACRGDGNTTDGVACTSTSVTIDPPVMMPDIRSGQSPGAWWGTRSTILEYAGLEDVTIDPTPASIAGIYFINCTNCWMRGVRVVRTDTISSSFFFNNVINGNHVTIQDSYFYGPIATSLVAIYGLVLGPMSNSLIQNNIIHASVNPIVVNTATYGNVVAFNYVDNTGMAPGLAQAGLILHGVAAYDLFEGNNWKNFSGDNIHTSHFFNTLFRDHHDGLTHSATGGETEAAVALYAVQRFFNVIGGVFGAANWNAYQIIDAENEMTIFQLGWRGSSGSASVTGDDARVAATLFRWGNFDSVNNTVRFQASENPSGITNFPNLATPSQTFPASFYLASQPAWWATAFGTPPWPAIGPDVTGGPLALSGGHAYKIPARLCFENTAVDPAYPSNNPRIKSFNAAACYTGGGSKIPNTATNLIVR